MQTFLPYPDFTKSAKCLDRLRLGKQRSEVIVLLKTLLGEDFGWKNHPATKMWRGCELTLAIYGKRICDEWIRRGYEDSCKEIIILLEDKIESRFLRCPQWWGDEKVHSSHRAALLKKDFNWYKQFGWKEEPKIEYYWPIS